jgi:hypothetical protein
MVDIGDRIAKPEIGKIILDSEFIFYHRGHRGGRSSLSDCWESQGIGEYPHTGTRSEGSRESGTMLRVLALVSPCTL